MRFINYIKKNVLAMFFRMPMKTIIDDALYQARRNLFDAELNAEHWNSEVTLMRSRVERLEAAAATEQSRQMRLV